MILITGITGYSGRLFVEVLAKNKFNEPIILIIRDKKTDLSFLKSIEHISTVYFGDLEDIEFLNDCMKNVDTVLHIASIFHSKKVAESATINKVKRLIFVHTTGIYSKYKSASREYQDIERYVNELVKNNPNSHLLVLRPTMIFGHKNDRNIFKFIDLLNRFRVLPIIDNGSNFIQPVHGTDLAEAYYNIINNKTIFDGDFILSGEIKLTIEELFQLILRFLNKQTYFINVPLPMAVLFGKIIRLITFNHVDYVEKIERMGEDRSFNHSEAKRIFGYQPKNFVQNLENEVKEYQGTRRKK